MAQAEGKLEILNSAYYEQIISISKKKLYKENFIVKYQVQIAKQSWTRKKLENSHTQTKKIIPKLCNQNSGSN